MLSHYASRISVTMLARIMLNLYEAATPSNATTTGRVTLSAFFAANTGRQDGELDSNEDY
jgi:hypothetical protein